MVILFVHCLSWFWFFPSEYDIIDFLQVHMRYSLFVTFGRISCKIMCLGVFPSDARCSSPVVL
jgi:hypothetical protein